jgi:hypothetical protein
LGMRAPNFVLGYTVEAGTHVRNGHQPSPVTINRDLF